MKRLARVIISVVLLVISVAMLAFLVWPRYQELSLLRAQVTEIRERLDRGQQALAQLRRQEEAVAEYEENFEKIDKAMPEDTGLPSLYEHIQQLGISTGLFVTSIEGKAAEGPAPEIAVLVFRAQFDGSYEGVKSFLDAARRSARILNVQTLKISADAENLGELQITIELSAYATKAL